MDTKAGARTNVRRMAQMGMLAAISVVLMLFEIPLPFAPAFYEIDFSEVPVLVGSFAMGPLAGAGIEFLKILLNFAVNGTDTAGVGEFANFLIGCALVVPAAACSMLGNYCGARYAIRGGGKKIRGMIFVVLGMLFVKMLADLFL